MEVRLKMESALKEYLDRLKGKRVAVIGLGVSNMPLVERLLDAGVPVLACDKRRREEFGGAIERLESRAMEVAALAAKVPQESMGMLKCAVRKIYDFQGFSNSLDYFAEMFNLARTNMQKKEMGEFRDSISAGGLKSALKERYD